MNEIKKVQHRSVTYFEDAPCYQTRGAGEAAWIGKAAKRGDGRTKAAGAS